MPPAETTTRRPARSGRGSAAAASRVSAAAKISSGSGSRPGPVSAAGEPAGRRVEHDHAALAQGRDVGLGRGVVPHLGVHRRREQHRAPRRQQREVSRSSARPCAARASRSAVAGATTTRSASRPSRTCGTRRRPPTPSSRPACPDSAAQVGAPTNSSAAAVGTTVTSCPDSVSSRSSETRLVRGDAPATRRGRPGAYAPAAAPAVSEARGQSPVGLGDEQAGVDLAQGDRRAASPARGSPRAGRRTPAGPRRAGSSRR